MSNKRWQSISTYCVGDQGKTVNYFSNQEITVGTTVEFNFYGEITRDEDYFKLANMFP